MNDILIRRGLGALVCASVLLSPAARARVVYVLDYDGTIVDDQSRTATWRTPWILKRIDQVRNLLQVGPKNVPETVEVSFREYRRLAARLAKGPGQIGPPGEETLDYDVLNPQRDLVIEPGRFAVSEDVTFKYYREGRGRGGNYLVRDLKAAIKRTKLIRESGGEGGWQGPAFPLLQAALKSAETASNLILFTARNHSHKEWRRYFEVLKEEGLVNFVPKNPRVYSMTDAEALQFAREGVGSRKAGVADAVAFEQANDSQDQHVELAPDEYEAARGITRQGHTLIFGEEEPRYVNALRQRLQTASSDLYLTHRLKFVLVNAGQPGDVAAAYFPWVYTVIHKGVGRPATPEEIAFWTGANGCEINLR